MAASTGSPPGGWGHSCGERVCWNQCRGAQGLHAAPEPEGQQLSHPIDSEISERDG